MLTLFGHNFVAVDPFFTILVPIDSQNRGLSNDTEIVKIGSNVDHRNITEYYFGVFYSMPILCTKSKLMSTKFSVCSIEDLLMDRMSLGKRIDQTN